MSIGGINPRILNFGTKWRRVVSVTHRMLCPGRNVSREALQLLATRNNLKDLDIFRRKTEKLVCMKQIMRIRTEFNWLK